MSYKKLLLGLGAIATTTMPIVAVISCGNDNEHIKKKEATNDSTKNVDDGVDKLTKPTLGTLAASTKPTTTTSHDGTITIPMNEIDLSKIKVTVDHGTIDVTTGIISGLTSGQTIKVSATPKSGEAWTDGTTNPIEKEYIAATQTVVGLTKVTLGDSTGSTKPTTTTSDDGTITIPMDPIDLTKMDVTVDHGTIDTTTGVISGLTSGEKVTVRVALKTGEAWTDGSDAPIEKEYTAATQTIVGLTKVTLGDLTTATKPTTTTTKDGTIGIPMDGILLSKMNVIVNHGVLDTKTGFVSRLGSGEKVTVRVALKTGEEVWTDGSKDVIEREYTALTQTVVGLVKPTLPDTVIIHAPRIATSNDGTIAIPMDQIDLTKMDVTVDHGTLDTGTGIISGLASHEKVTVRVELKTRQVWTDGTVKAIEKTYTMPTQADLKLTKPTLGVATATTKPKTTTSQDGTITIPMDPIDLTKMDVMVDHGTIDITTGVISGLTSGQKVKVSITPKVNYAWTDRTKDAIEKEYTAATQSVVGLTKPTLAASIASTKPTTTTSQDGTITIPMDLIDLTKMDVMVDHGTIDTTTGVISGLTSGQKVKVSITPKVNEVWTDGTTNPVEKEYIAATQTVVGLTKVTLGDSTGSTKPTTTTSDDGTITIPMDPIDLTKMDVTVNQGVIDTNTWVISGLTSGEKVTVRVALKTGEVWTDGSKAPIEKEYTAATQSVVGLTKPTLAASIASTKPTTTTSQDGTITIPMDPIDLTKMDVMVDHGTIDTTTGVISGLTSGQKVKVSITPKVNEVWTDGTTNPVEKEYIAATQTVVGLTKVTLGDSTGSTKPTTTTSDDGTITIPMDPIDLTKMDVTVNQGVIDTNTWVISGLTSGEKVTVRVALKTGEVWADGSKAPIEKEYTTPVQTVVGLTKPTLPNTVIIHAPSGATSNDGTITIPMDQIDLIKMDVTVDHGTLNTGTGVITGLTSREKVTVRVALKTGEVWTDGAVKAIEKTYTVPTRTDLELTKPTLGVATAITKPKTTTTQDGSITIPMRPIDLTKMDVAVDHGTIDTTSGVVSGLASGQIVKVSVTPKVNYAWTDGTVNAIERTYTVPTQANVGLTKPTLKVATGTTKPTTTTSKDGSITIPNDGIDLRKMDITVNHGTIDITTGVISGLTSGQIVKVTIKPKHGEVWTDGSVAPIEKEYTTPTQIVVGLTKPALDALTASTKPTTTTTQDGSITIPNDGIDLTKMDVTVDHGTLDTTTWIILGLISGEKVTVRVALKTGEVWADGSKDDIEKEYTSAIQSVVGLTKPTLGAMTASTKPTTTTSDDGTITIPMDQIDLTKMDVTAYYATIDTKTGIISGLTSAEVISVEVTPKGSEVWTDGTVAPVREIYISPEQTVVGLTKVTLGASTTSTKPTTTTSKDGTITIPMDPIDLTKMDVTVDHGTIDTTTGVISGLTSGQKVKVTIKPKHGEVWTDGSVAPIEKEYTTPTQIVAGLTKPTLDALAASTKPATTTSQDGDITILISGIDLTKMDVTVDHGTIHTPNGLGVITGLTSGQKVKVTIKPKHGEVWTDGSVAPIEKEYTTPTQIYVGLTKPTLGTTITTHVPTTTSNDGTITIPINEIDLSKMDVTVNHGTLNTGTGVISGLKLGEKITISITLKTGEKWTDGTANPIEKEYMVLPRFTKPDQLITSHQFSSYLGIVALDKDELGWITKMDIKVDHGTYDAGHGWITGVKSGQKITLTITLKYGAVWTDGTNGPETKIIFT